METNVETNVTLGLSMLGCASFLMLGFAMGKGWINLQKGAVVNQAPLKMTMTGKVTAATGTIGGVPQDKKKILPDENLSISTDSKSMSLDPRFIDVERFK